MRSSPLSQVVHFVINNAAIAKEYRKIKEKCPFTNNSDMVNARKEDIHWILSSVAKQMAYQSLQSKDSYAICFAMVALDSAGEIFGNQKFKEIQN